MRSTTTDRLAPWLRAHGFGDDDLAWCAEHVARPDVLGINFYPHISTTEDVAGAPALLHARPEEGAAGPEEVARAWAQRYGVPLFLTETSAEGSPQQRCAWPLASLAVLARLRAGGVDVGYRWWPLFHFVEWEYRPSAGPPESHLFAMGLYDLRPDAVGVLERVETPVVERFRAYANGRIPVFAPGPGAKDGGST